jgi:hypothetical protein
LRSWWRPTSRHAVSMCGTFRMSSTTICRRRLTPICIASAARAVPREPGWPSPSSLTKIQLWWPRLSARSAHHWSDGCCTASIMPRPGLRVTPTVAAHRTARSRNVPWPSQRPSGARQSPAYGKRLQMSHPLRPCQERQGEDGLPPVADAGNQQGQGLDGGELASYPWRTLSQPCERHETGLARLQRAGFHSIGRRCALHGGTQSSRAFARVSPAPTLRGGQTQQHSIHAHEWISLWHSQQRKRNTQAPSTAEGLMGDPSETQSWKAIDSGDVRGNAYCVMRSSCQHSQK